MIRTLGGDARQILPANGAMLSGQDDTGSGRMAAVQALEEFGVAGSRLNNFPAVYKRSVPSSGFAEHNMYLIIPIELGNAATFVDQLWSKTVWLALTLLMWSGYSDNRSDEARDESCNANE